MGGVAHKPWRATAAEAALIGARVGERAFEAAAEAALRGARGYGHNDFKIELAKRTLRQTLAAALEA